MLRQYHSQRRRGGHNPRGIGVIELGQILYLQDFRPLGGVGRGPICRNPWIVESFANREYFPAVKGGPAVKYIAGGHLVTVRSLRDGRRQQVADWLILCAIDNDLEWLGARYARQQRRARQTAGGYPRAAAAAARRAA